MAKVLMIHPNREAREELEQCIKDVCEAVFIDPVSNEKEARERLQHQSNVRDCYDIIITRASIPENRREGCNDAATRGIELLRSLPQFGHSGKPCILIAPHILDLQNRARGIDRLYFIEEDMDWYAKATECTQQIICKSDIKPPPMLARITLTLDMKNRRWDGIIRGEGFSYPTNYQPLSIDVEIMDSLIGRSLRLSPDNKSWEAEFRAIGVDLARHIFSKNYEFFGKIKEAAARAGGPDHKTICFNVEEQIYPMMLEALTPAGEPDFWMLEVPIYRRLISTEQRVLGQKPLFSSGKREESFGALIIESPVSGYVPIGDSTQQFGSLMHVSAEADWLESKLKGWGAAQVERLSLDSLAAGESFKAQLEKLLNNPAAYPDIVHYCGHTYYDQNTHNGYLIIPGQPIDILGLDMFSTWLSRNRFLFLSGCQSSQEGFVFQLARRQLPIVLGFRWPIDDDAAFEFTQEFYTNLFEGESAYCVDRAFLSAQRAMKARIPNNKIWAAPILILQGNG